MEIMLDAMENAGDYALDVKDVVLEQIVVLL